MIKLRITPFLHVPYGFYEYPAATTDYRALWPLHNSPHYERLMRRPPVLPGYYPSSEMGSKSHNTIIIPTREARTRLLILRLLIRELAVPPSGRNKRIGNNI
ncbi:hypothetical protein AVEN_92585-1 [Araneus ventricosus]|uniref:Uncharacterized protein n=1 Tax=Araneus ventricosus TaxID=182803 RepID=A0A4Y2AI34_ARAVE|nr:hypothetical protein AVEN_92585-1 [Araneus ventricosus]